MPETQGVRPVGPTEIRDCRRAGDADQSLLRRLRQWINAVRGRFLGPGRHANGVLAGPHPASGLTRQPRQIHAAKQKRSVFELRIGYLPRDRGSVTIYLPRGPPVSGRVRIADDDPRARVQGRRGVSLGPSSRYARCVGRRSRCVYVVFGRARQRERLSIFSLCEQRSRKGPVY